MTSYPFSRRPQHRNSISGFVFGDFAHLGRSKSTRRPNFGTISLSTAEINYFQFQETNGLHVGILLPVSFSPLGRHWHVILHRPIEFHPNRLSATELWRRSDFQDGGSRPCWISSRVTADHPRRAPEGLSLAVKFRIGRSYSFGVIAIFTLWRFSVKLPIRGYIRAVETKHTFWFRGVDLPIQHPTSKGVAARIRDVYWWSPLC